MSVKIHKLKDLDDNTRMLTLASLPKFEFKPNTEIAQIITELKIKQLLHLDRGDSRRAVLCRITLDSIKQKFPDFKPEVDNE